MTKPTTSSKATPTSQASSVGWGKLKETWKLGCEGVETEGGAGAGARGGFRGGGACGGRRGRRGKEGVVGACRAVFGSSTASFRMAEAPVVEAADLGRLFWG
ncbi:hypothetical protein TIFTF001_042184 [Ficus carica]|uniref:Uncharacterized protein n=1 Tax=Ficus carica TaxID=3494 RepID=A0AA88CX51_FICCA|nr:hypothetical protein TIFTF001_042184 [Ficus carica]